MITLSLTLLQGNVENKEVDNANEECFDDLSNHNSSVDEVREFSVSDHCSSTTLSHQ